MTFCEEKGYRVGDKFVVTEDSNFNRFDVIRLIEDDGSNSPLFELVSGIGPRTSLSKHNTPTAFEYIRNLYKLEYEQIFEQSTPKGVITTDKLKQLAIDSGFQIEFHPDGMVHVWDEVAEEGTKGTLDEIVELAEAKIEYSKVWAKFTWQ